MNNHTLAQSYLIKATKRLRVLDVLMEEEAYSDVVPYNLYPLPSTAVKTGRRRSGTLFMSWRRPGWLCPSKEKGGGRAKAERSN